MLPQGTKLALIGLFLIIVHAAFALEPAQLPDRGDTPLLQLTNDERVVLIQRQGLAETLRFMQQRNDLFPAEQPDLKHMLSREQKEEIWSTWVSFLDRFMLLDSIGQRYADYREQKDPVLRRQQFRIAYAAFLARYRYSLDFLAITERDPVFHTILNERIPELGLDKGTYVEFKYHYLHLAIATEFAALGINSRLFGEDETDALQPGINDDRAVIWRYGGGEGIKQTVRNGAQIVKDSSFNAFFPIQKGVSDWMGDVKVLRVGESLIAPEQIAALPSRLQPGDVLLERREWYLSNVGLPGFWPHAALYIGTREERQRYFDDPQVADWVRGQGVEDGAFERLLQTREPQAYATSLSPAEAGHPARIIEAVGEGVLFTSVEHSADADSLAVLRPRLDKREKAQAILAAFHYSGRPYDFNFDFLTDDTLVCTELVYKAYEGSSERQGIRFPTLNLLGRLALPANEIVKQFDRNYGTAQQQFELVIFLDGQERERQAREADLQTFRESWKRPKWHVITQGTVLGKNSGNSLRAL